MKRRFFIAGLIAAPAAIAAAPAIASVEDERLTKALKFLSATPPPLKTRSGFTAAEIKAINDAAITYYLEDSKFRVYRGNDVVAYDPSSKAA